VRLLGIAFALLILALQYPLWLGKGGWLRVRELNTQVEAQKDVNIGLKARNAALDAEVRDLKQGTEAIEERARSELGMVKQDEVFVQFRQRPEQARDEPLATMPSPGGTTSLPIRPGNRPADKR
jgi:cell division protein FtsB